MTVDAMSGRVRGLLRKRAHDRTEAEQQELSKYLRRTPGLLHSMPQAVVEALCQRLTFMEVQPHGVVVRQGDYGQTMYCVLEGVCLVYRHFDGKHVTALRDDGSADLGAQTGTVLPGEIFGELALVNASKRRNATVVAGEDPVLLVGLDRACFQHFAEPRPVQHGTFRELVSGALRAACCRRILHTASSNRTPDDLEALVAFLQPLDAFKDLSPALMTKLCKGMQMHHATANTVICHEDEPGDSMYVVISGTCTVRAHDPPDKPDKMPGRAHGPSCTDSVIAPTTVVRRAARQKLADEDKLLAHTHQKEKELAEQEERSSNRDSQFWITKFMQSATQQIDPELSGYHQQITPLAAVVNAKWRRTLQEVQEDEERERLAKEKAREEEEAERKAREEGMAGLLGKAAASNWRRATFGDKSAERESVDWRALSVRLKEQREMEAKLQEAALTAAQRIVHEEDEGSVKAGERPSGPAEHQDAEPRASATLYNPSKQKLAEMGKRVPENVSKQLLAELSQRSDIDTVLGALEKVIQRQGPARRLGRRDSRQITRALNRSMLNGASKQHGKLRVPRLTGRMAAGTHGGATETGTLIDTEDWRSSVDFSEVGERSSFAPADEKSVVGTERSLGGEVTDGGETDDEDLAPWQRDAHHWHHGADILAIKEGRRTRKEVADPHTICEDFGDVVREVHAGQSFGELALLQPHTLRTASVVAGPAGTGHALETIPSEMSMEWSSATGLGQGSAYGGAAAYHGVDLIKISRSLFDQAVTSLQVSQLEQRLQFLMSVPVFQTLQRDRLTALAVFLSKVEVPAGAVLACQGANAEHMMLIQEGEVALVLEGAKTGNPMDPYNAAMAGELIVGMSHLAPGCSAAMRSAVERNYGRHHSVDNDVVHNRFLMRQLSGKAQQLSIQEIRKREEDEESQRLLAEAARRWGDGHPKGVHDKHNRQQDEATLPFQQRHVNGMQLLRLTAGDIVGEQALGFKAPEVVEEVDPKQAAKVLVAKHLKQVARERDEDKGRVPKKPLRKRVLRRGDSASEMRPAKDYVEVEAEVKPEGFQATVVAVKPCVLLVVSAADLLRFGSGVKEQVQERAWSQRELLMNIIERTSKANDALDAEFSTVRQTPGITRAMSSQRIPPPPLFNTRTARLAQSSEQPRASQPQISLGLQRESSQAGAPQADASAPDTGAGRQRRATADGVDARRSIPGAPALARVSTRRLTHEGTLLDMEPSSNGLLSSSGQKDTDSPAWLHQSRPPLPHLLAGQHIQRALSTRRSVTLTTPMADRTSAGSLHSVPIPKPPPSGGPTSAKRSLPPRPLGTRNDSAYGEALEAAAAAAAAGTLQKALPDASPEFAKATPRGMTGAETLMPPSLA